MQTRLSQCFKVFLIFSVVVLFGLWQINSLLIYSPHHIVEKEFIDQTWVALSAKNPRGETIAGWYFPGKSVTHGMVLCHGHAADHTQIGPVVPFFQNLGFSFITLDFRAHGKSTGDFTSIGMHEWEDIQAILDEAEKKNLISSQTILGAFGCSMGAATLANGIKRLPRIKSVILESCFAELRTVAAHDVEYFTKLPDNFLMDIVFWIGIVRSGYQYYENQPIRALREVSSTPVLLIQDGADPRISAADFERLSKAIPQARTLVIPQAPHIGGYGIARQEYEKEVSDFLRSTRSLP